MKFCEEVASGSKMELYDRRRSTSFFFFFRRGFRGNLGISGSSCKQSAFARKKFVKHLIVETGAL